MPRELLLDIIEDENEIAETPIRSSPGLFRIEQRMANMYKPPNKNEMINVKSTDDIIKKLAEAKLTKLGQGTTSEGFIATIGSQKYIVRKTHIYSPQVRNHIKAELEVYKHIQQYPESSQYISKLLYADIPLIYHKNNTYNTAYFVFEYRKGLPLDVYIEEHRLNPTKSFEEIMTWITQLSNAIIFLDLIGIYHRDIKPANIFINFDTWLPLLFDFENACKKDSCTVSDFRGTRQYATPRALELLDQHTFKTYTYGKYYDFYSLAVLLEKDLVKITRDSDKHKLLEYAKHVKEQFRQFGGFKIPRTDKPIKRTIRRKNRTQRVKYKRKITRKHGGVCPCSTGQSWFSK